MTDWVAAHPRDERAPRGLVWMAQLRLAHGEQARARSYFLRVVRDYPGTEWALHSVKGLADLELQSRHYGAAIAQYDALARSRLPFFQYIGALSARRARAERLRGVVLLGGAVAFLLLWLVRLRRLRGLQQLWPPPLELLCVLPVLLLMGAASLAQPAQEGRAIRALTLGAVGLLWLDGAYLRAHPPAGWRRLVAAALGLAQGAGLLYATIILSGLWEKFYDTLVMGAE